MLLVVAFAAVGSAAIGSSTLALVGGTTGMPEAQKQQVTQRKTEIAQRIEAKKAEKTEKLDQKRLAVCQKRQEKISTIFAKATEQNRLQLAVFQAIEENVKAFYAKHNLTADGYDAALATANEKEATAVAALDVSDATTFDCTTTDNSKPGSVIKEAMTVRHEALKDYRTAIKNLILVVKKHNGEPIGTAQATTEETKPTTGEGQ